MALDPASVTSRSNSDLLAIEMIANNTSMSPEARMLAIHAVVGAWDLATQNSTGRHTAVREVHQRQQNKTLYGKLR